MPLGRGVPPPAWAASGVAGAELAPLAARLGAGGPGAPRAVVALRPSDGAVQPLAGLHGKAWCGGVVLKQKIKSLSQCIQNSFSTGKKANKNIHKSGFGSK